MQGEVKERWRKLCEDAAVEQDPERLMVLIEQIDRLLAEKEQRVSKTKTVERNAA